MRKSRLPEVVEEGRCAVVDHMLPAGQAELETALEVRHLGDVDCIDAVGVPVPVAAEELAMHSDMLLGGNVSMEESTLAKEAMSNLLVSGTGIVGVHEALEEGSHRGWRLACKGSAAWAFELRRVPGLPVPSTRDTCLSQGRYGAARDRWRGSAALASWGEVANSS